LEHSIVYRFWSCYAPLIQYIPMFASLSTTYKSTDAIVTFVYNNIRHILQLPPSHHLEPPRTIDLIRRTYDKPYILDILRPPYLFITDRLVVLTLTIWVSALPR
jgi:hypothetical protein